MLIDKCPTGIEDLDMAIGGGFPRGALVLLAGNPGAGKTTLAAKFLYEGIKKYGEPGVMLSFSEPLADFIRNMKLLDLDFEALDRDSFSFIEAYTAVDKQAITVLMKQLTSEVSRINARRLVIDSITALVGGLMSTELRALLHNTLMRLCKVRGVTAILIADLPVGVDVVGYGVEEFVVDGLIKLYMNYGPTGVPERKIEIVKLRGAPLKRVIYEFTIGRGGISLFIPAGPEAGGKIGPGRISTGIAELDSMLGGGLLKGSVTILDGISGSGKTTIALRFALEGLKGGEPILYISLNEPNQQVVDRLTKIDKVDKNLAHIISPSYLKYTKGGFYDMVIRSILKFDVKRVVMDGIEMLRIQYGPKGASQLISSISAFTKSKGITMILTSSKAEDCYYMVDNVIKLSLTRFDNSLVRTIEVVKSRGSDHSYRIRKMSITDKEVLIYE